MMSRGRKSGVGDGAARESAGPPWLSRDESGAWLLRVKAVPGASRDEIAGPLGDRLKVRVAAPPEGGQANKAICRLIAKRLGVSAREVDVTTGRTTSEKTVRVESAANGKVIATRLG